jgi:hypothetical protein
MRKGKGATKGKRQDNSSGTTASRHLVKISPRLMIGQKQCAENQKLFLFK